MKYQGTKIHRLERVLIICDGIVHNETNKINYYSK